MDVFHRLANDHPGVGGRATRIQAIFRGFINRKKRDEEIKKNKAEFDSDQEDGEEKDGKDGKEEGKEGEGKEGEEKAEAAASAAAEGSGSAEGAEAKVSEETPAETGVSEEAVAEK
jgi:hypothetical protein